MRKISIGIYGGKDNFEQHVPGGRINITRNWSQLYKCNYGQASNDFVQESMMGFCEHGDETMDSAMFINTTLRGETKVHFEWLFSTWLNCIP